MVWSTEILQTMLVTNENTTNTMKKTSFTYKKIYFHKIKMKKPISIEYAGKDLCYMII